MGFSAGDVRYTKICAHCVHFVRDVRSLIVLLVETLDWHNPKTNRCLVVLLKMCKSPNRAQESTPALHHNSHFHGYAHKNHSDVIFTQR